jgi:hypothetical protein
MRSTARSCLMVAVLIGTTAVSSGCHETNVCQEALDKYNDCKHMTPDTGGYSYRGACTDRAELVDPVTGQSYVIAFKTWAEQYVECDLDTTTCACPGLTPLEELLAPPGS